MSGIRYKTRAKAREARLVTHKKHNETPASKARRRRHCLKRNGWTPESYDVAYKAQHGACSICSDIYSTLRPDHNHVTGEPRALLCTHCNTALGMFKDSIYVLERALDYLRRHNG